MIKVQMLPHIDHYRDEQSGIRRVVEAYFKHLPAFDIEMVHPDAATFDLLAIHAGMRGSACDVAHCHGLYWTADFPQAPAWQKNVNAQVISSIRQAREVTVPAEWVAEAFQRDMRFTPTAIGHAVDWEEWQHDRPNEGYVLWNKNRDTDVCDPTPLTTLAGNSHDDRFITTFLPRGAARPRNVTVTGLIPHAEMKLLIQSAGVYLATTKETFGIGTLEAMAAGVPILGFAHGGILDMVEHGVNGYLAEPGHYLDLVRGLDYCMQHRDALGANGREMAQRWTWAAACEKVAAVYRRALQRPPSTVAIVVPVYSKTGEQVTRAVESAMAQTYDQLTDVVVVDDGSQNGDEIQAAVTALTERDRRVRFIRQNNRGVAHARNRGIAESDTKYVCCLDADDAIEPEFIARCVFELEKDRSLGMAYTGLRWIKADGSSNISQWPGAWNYDNQLQRQNQVPTCCVFRRQMWERLGGYRQRYAPRGCGSEDAEFWTRAGAYGWGGMQVTTKPLFVYSWGTGLVTSDRNYSEPDWLGWHPWAQDGEHPFASRATPQRFSHPVRQYDRPTVSVIIPVGPHHQADVIDALDSLEAQVFRHWEAVVVDDTGGDLQGQLGTAYPYVRWVKTEGEVGAGAARNRGVEASRAPFLVFLDADDRLYPAALDRFVQEWAEHKEIIYSDYVGKAIISEEHAHKMQDAGRLLHYDPQTAQAVIAHQAFEYDCERAQAQPEGEKPYIWCNITVLLPRIWHDEIGGFDEQMDSWEDVDYHYRLARVGKCYHRVPTALLVYNFSGGRRRESGRQTHEKLVQYLSDKYEGRGVMPCVGCSKKRHPSVRAIPQPQSAERRPAAQMTDGDFVLARYIVPNKGDHPVYGSATFPQRLANVPMAATRQGFIINYGYKPGGGQVRFLVHRRDVELSPHRFQQEQDEIISAPRAERQPLPPPQQVVAPVAPEIPPPAAPTAPMRDAQDEPVDVEAAVLGPSTTRPFDPQTLPGVNESVAAQMAEEGVASADDILALGIKGLKRYSGVGEKRAEMIIGAIEAMQQS